MAADAGAKNLLYVVIPTENVQGVVNAYSYPDGTLEGQITDLAYPDGDCTDPNGDLYVTDTGPSHNRIVEFAHGGTHPIRKLSVPGYYAYSCAIDPINGDLAVADVGNAQGQGIDVVVFRQAKGRPRVYTDSDFLNFLYCAYDNAHDLFVDGHYPGGYQLPKVAELPRRGKSLVTLNLNYQPGWLSSVQWDGKYVAIGQGVKPSIFRYKIVGTNAIYVGSTALTDSTVLLQFILTGKRAIVLNGYYDRYISREEVLIYNYPAGGDSTQTFINPDTVLGSIALSRRR